MIFDETSIDELVLGGAFLGGGGGGTLEEGLRLGREALQRGRPTLISLDELPDDGLLATVSAVGAPAAPDKLVTPDDFITAVRLLVDRAGKPLSGLISSENGGLSSINGLVQSAALGLPVVDAPCNGRAHPTGIMGSMGLGKRPGFVSRQGAAGGNAANGRQLRLYIEAALPHADAVIRQAAVEAGGLIAVARNPVEAGYVRRHGAPGALRMARMLGQIIARGRADGVARIARDLSAAIGAEVVGCGPVADLALETRGGYDIGRLIVGDLELTFWNEYMTLESGCLRLATFPDLICTLDARDGTPRTSAELEEGIEITVLCVPRQNLILGAGMREPENLEAAERALNRSIKAFTTATGKCEAPSRRESS